MPSGQYIWRTVQDGEVRSHHASREGKVFSWNDPPPGGHPGEDYNCRCWAEEKDCVGLRLELREIVKELTPLDHKLSMLGADIHDTEGEIEELKSKIDFLENFTSISDAAEHLDRIRHLLAKALAVVAKITLELVLGDIEEKREELQEKKHI